MNPPLILHVEDEADDALFVEIAFQRAKVNCRIQRAGDGEEAIHYLSGVGPFADRERHAVPALMLLDLKLPCLDGFEVLAWTRRQPDFTSLPVIVLSGSDLEADRSKALLLGANAYFVKNASYSELVQHVAAELLVTARHKQPVKGLPIGL